MKEIVLNKKNIEKIKRLLQYIPSEFTAVPLNIYKENNIWKAKISTITPTFSLAFNTEIELENIENYSIDNLTVRLPINKSVINQIFNSKYDNVNISEIRCVAENKKTTVTVTMLNIDEKSNIKLPAINEELYNMIINNNSNFVPGKIQFDINPDDITEFLNSYSVLNMPNKDDIVIKIKNTKDSLIIESKDNIENGFKFKFDIDDKTDCNIKSSYSNILIDVMIKCNRCRNGKINVLFSNPIIGFTIYDEDIIITYGIPSKND